MIFPISRRLCLIAIAGLPLVAQGELTVDQIVDKHVAAVGGIEKYRALSSLKVTGKAIMGGGQMTAPFILQLKRPSSMRMEMQMQGRELLQGFDGTTAWRVIPFLSPDPQKANEEETKRASDDADFEGVLIDYKKKGNTVELQGKEDVDGTPAYKLKLTTKSGTVQTHFIDASTFLTLKVASKQKQMGQEFDVEQFPTNYKPVGGVLMPHSFEQKMNGKPMMQLLFENVEVNPTIDNAVFRMPAKEEKPAESKPAESKPAESKPKPEEKKP